jgi:transcriptional regulator with XRE-family HTH domain
MNFMVFIDIMISINLSTPQEILQKIAEKVRAKRLYLDLSQQTLAARSGVSYGVLKKFERTGQISLESLLKLALVLGSLVDFDRLFALPLPQEALSLDELMQEGKRKRGRK